MAQYGQLKIALVYKKSRLELYQHIKPRLKELVIQKDISVDYLEQSDAIHKRHVQLVRDIVHGMQLDVLECPREELAKRDLSDRLVVTVGGDGTILEASQHVNQQPILGVNSDPNHSLGSLCTATVDTLLDTLKRVLDGGMNYYLLPRISIVLDGQLLSIAPINDLLIANSHPAVISHYIVETEEQAEEQKSSGLWVGTGLGSSSAIASAGGRVMSIEDTRLQVVVREPSVMASDIPQKLHFFCKRP